MCMRFARESKLSQIEKEFNIDEVVAKIFANYNIAPTNQLASIVREDERNKLVDLKWGLVPSWAKDDSYATKLCNARAETISEKPSFKDSFKNRRCLIVADGYFEWYTKGKLKMPVYITLKSGKPFVFAGLYSENAKVKPAYTDQDKKNSANLRTCTIITTASSEYIEKVHHRMPVILKKEFHADWLAPENHDTIMLSEVLTAYPEDEMAYYDVTRNVNSVRNNTPDNIEPIETQESLF